MGIITSSKRLALRELTSADAGFILTLLNDPDWLTHIGDRGVRAHHDAVRYIEDGPVASYRRNGFGLWHVSVKGTNEPVGLCGLLQREALDHPDLGYALLPAYRSQGYAREAGRAVLDFAARKLDKSAIDAIVSPRNERSIRLLLDLGFALVGQKQLGPGEDPVDLYRMQL